MDIVEVDETDGDRKYVVMKSYNLQGCIDYAFEHRHEISGLEFSRHKGFFDDSLDFLKSMPWLKHLVFADDYGDLSVISHLERLEFLSVANPKNIDFSNLKNLTEYSGDWPKKILGKL